MSVVRVGHKGADALVPGNTLASLDAALAHGVDMIEFDVLPATPTAPDGRLLLAHDYEHALPDAPDLDTALAHLAGVRFAGLEFDLDLKLPGYERRVVEALRAHGLIERTLVSTLFMRSLIELRALAPELRLGWSVPRVKRDYTASMVLMAPAYAWLWRARRRLPRIAAEHVRAGRCDALMAHWRLVTPRLASALRAVGGKLFVWTVDDAAQIRALAALGVTGVISNDPRLFADRPRTCLPTPVPRAGSPGAALRRSRRSPR